MAAPAPAPAPAPNAHGVVVSGIVYDINCPTEENGGIAAAIPAGHAHADHGNRYYYRKIATALRAAGYQNVQKSVWMKNTPAAAAIADACNLQTHPDATWMAVPGVMSRMHVVEFAHAGSIY